MKKMCRREFLWIAFGGGCVVACCLPTVWITRILAIVVIVLGIICCKRQGEVLMKVILIKSPKILAPILRAVFKVKKITYDD